MLKARPIPPAVPTEQAGLCRAPTYWLSRLREDAFGYMLLAPALLVILGLNLYPVICGFLTSFTNQSLLNPNAWNWVGLANYQKLFSDPVFRLSFIHSLQLTVAAVVLQVVWGLVLAHLLIQKIPGIHFFHSIAMITWVLPIITAVVMFRFITLPNFGFINILLRSRSGWAVSLATGSATSTRPFGWC
jgi:ABC-type sugar transport system permease subunit